MIAATTPPQEPRPGASGTQADGRHARLLQTSAGTLTDAFGAREWGLLTAVALIWGSSFLFIAVGLEAFRPGLVSLLRVALGALALGLVPRARQPVGKEDLRAIAVLGVVWMAVPLLLFPIAQQWIDSSVAGMINGAVPITTAAWATVLLRRLPGRRQLAGIALGFLGVVAIFVPELRGSSASALGAVLVGLAVVCYGLSANLAVPLQQRYGALPVLWRAQLVALVLIAPFGLAQLPGSTWSLPAAVAMLPLGVLGTGLAFALMTTLVGRVGGPRGSIAIYFTPIVALALGVAVRGERIDAMALLGTALVLLGAWFTSRRE